MQRAFLFTAIAAMLAIVGNNSATAREAGKDIYDVTYLMSINGEQETTRTASDGQGHVRIEKIAPRAREITIWDLPNKVIYTLNEAKKIALRDAFVVFDSPGVSEKSDGMLKAWAQSESQPVGHKTVAGRACHGFDTAEVSLWVTDDSNMLVYQRTKTRGMDVSKKLVNYSTTAPDRSLFAVPSGYRVVSSRQPASSRTVQENRPSQLRK